MQAADILHFCACLLLKSVRDESREDNSPAKPGIHPAEPWCWAALPAWVQHGGLRQGQDSCWGLAGAVWSWGCSPPRVHPGEEGW